MKKEGKKGSLPSVAGHRGGKVFARHHIKRKGTGFGKGKGWTLLIA